MKLVLALLGVFALGLFVGVWFTRGDGGTSTLEIQQARDVSLPPASSSVAGSAPPAASALPSAPAPAGQPAIAGSGPATPPPPTAPAPVARPAAGFEAPIDSGVVRAIDVGDVLRKQIERPSEPGNENHIGDAHRALEREPRDDSWAYTMEAELQNSMIGETSTGGFRAASVECRTTMCEIWLTGNGDQAAAVRRWSESLATSPMTPQLQLNMSSTISSHDRIDGLFIFRKPAKR
jgi:hypothetical protein